MTKKELIEALAQFDDDVRVVVNGYEGGYDDIEKVELIRLRLHSNGGSFSGEHDEAIREEEDPDSSCYEIVDAIRLDRWP